MVASLLHQILEQRVAEEDDQNHDQHVDRERLDHRKPDEKRARDRAFRFGLERDSVEGCAMARPIAIAGTMAPSAMAKTAVS